VTAGSRANGHESERLNLGGLLGREIVELDKEERCRARTNDDVVLVALGLVQNAPYRVAHVLKAPAGALLALYRRAGQICQAEVEEARADAAKGREHSQRFADWSVPYPFVHPMPRRASVPNVDVGIEFSIWILSVSIENSCAALAARHFGRVNGRRPEGAQPPFDGWAR
jgi:hypothetical protein